MTLPPAPHPPPPGGPSTDRDRRYRVGLFVFGVLEILAGIFLGLSAAGMAALALGGAEALGIDGTMPSTGTGGGTLLMAAPLYAGLGVLLVSLGVGSLLPRRWVRPLVLYVATLWLLAGILLMVAVAGIVAMAGSTLALADPDAESMAGIGSVPILVVLGFVLFVFYVAVPAALLVFHRRRGLKEALDRLDPVTRWTDRCPTPVLSLSLSLAISAAFCVPFVRGPLPLFGWTLTGAAAAVVTSITAVVLAWLALATYRRSAAGWWGSLAALVVLTAVSVDLSFRFDLSRLGEDFPLAPMGAAPGAAPDAAGAADAAGWLLGAASLLFGAVCLVALLRVRRYFKIHASGPEIAVD